MIKDDIKGKKLLVMGGTRITCQLIQCAKNMGCFVGVADYNPPEKSPGKKIADKAYLISTLDTEAMVRLVRSEKYDGILVGFNDLQLPYYAEICRETGFPAYATKEQLELFINKDKYKPLLRQFGIPTTEDYYIEPDQPDKGSNSVVFPVLVKPADSSGARGITVCYCWEELQEAIKKARSFSRTGVVLVERYIEGREVTVNWVFQNGEYYLTSIANRHVKHNQDGVIPLPVGYTYPASILPAFRDKYEEKCKAMFRSVGIKNGMMFMQCKLDGNVPVVYDIGFRLTGTQEYLNIEDVCGYNPMKMMIRFALTGDMGEPELDKKVDPCFGNKYGFNVSCLSSPGRIKELCGVEEVRKFPEVIDSVVAHFPGEEITESMKGLLAQITVRTFGTVEKEDELYKAMKKVDNAIHIISSEGKELKLPGIEKTDVEGYVLKRG